MTRELDTRSASWRTRSDQRGWRTIWRRLAVVGVVLLVVAAGVTGYKLTRPDPAVQLTEASRAFAADWPTMSIDELCATWFVPDLTETRRSRLDRIFERRGWQEQRPPIIYLLDEMRHDALKGRSEYEIEGFPPDRPLEIFWNRVDGAWRVTAPTIPILKDEK